MTLDPTGRRSAPLSTLLCVAFTLTVGFALTRASFGEIDVNKPKKHPTPGNSGIQHIVVVMMENRSFDHLLGWHPNAEGMQAGLTYLDADGTAHETHPLAPDWQGCAHPDPDHSFEGGRVEYDNGAMDGFRRAGDNDDYAIGFYAESDKQFFSALARNYTTADHSFASIMAETYPNRIFLHAAQTDRITNTLAPSTLPTIWDRLAAAGLSARYYVSDLSFLALWGTRYGSITRSYSQFLADAAAGTLPKVAFVEPRLLGDEFGLSGSDHPHADIRVGDAFLARTFRAVSTSPNWRSTVFIVTYDEWGGFFDHVAPPRATAPNNVDPDIIGGKTLLGMRVPTVIASPFSKGNPASPRVVSTVFDHTSILKLIEWRWRLAPLTARDASTDVGGLQSALDLNTFDPVVPSLPMPSSPTVTPCSPVSTTQDQPTAPLPADSDAIVPLTPRR